MVKVPSLRTLWQAAVLAAALSSIAPAQSHMTWIDLTTFGPGFAPAGLRIADVAGSPLRDLLMTSSSGNFLRILVNQGLGVAPLLTDVVVGSSPDQIANADLDGDGDQDVVTRNATSVSVLLLTGFGWARTDYPLGGAGRLAIADVDVDGIWDVVRGNQAILATGPGTFGPVTTLFGSGTPIDAIPGDFNGDGAVDFVFVHPTTPPVTTPFALAADLYINGGSGVFALPTSTPLVAGVYHFGFTCGDLDQDGDDDLVLITHSDQTGMAWVFPAAAGGLLPPLVPEDVAAAWQTAIPQLEDLDNDGSIDAVVRFTSVDPGFPPWASPFSTSQTQALINDGSGRLRYGGFPSGFQSVGAAPPIPPFAVGDVDGDGDADYAEQDLGQPSVTIAVGLVGPPLSFPVPATMVPLMPVAIAAPFVVALPVPQVRVFDAAGVPLPSVAVDFAVTSGAASITALPPGPRFTGPDGTATMTTGGFLALAPGQAVITASLLGTTSTITFTIDVMPLTVSITGGDLQTVPAGATLPLPLTVGVTDASGAPVAGVPISFWAYALPGTVSVQFQNGVLGYTNAAGEIALTCTCPNVGIAHVRGCPGTLRSTCVVFTINVVPPYGLSSGGGGFQVADLGEAFQQPLVAQVASTATPLSNIPVSWSVSPAGTASFQPPSPVLTDSLGLASVVVTPAFGGPMTVTASVPGSTPPVTYSLFARELGATGTAASGAITITYSHEHGPVPFMFAADVPQPMPVATPYGAVHTSILAPAPTLVVLDGMGAFGPPNPAIVANPGWMLTVPLPPTLSGFPIVMQVYGIDAAYLPVLSQAAFISNPVYRTL